MSLGILGIIGWIGIAIFLIIRIVKFLKKLEIDEIKKENQIQEGNVKYTDLDKPAKALFSKRLFLAGKPDYIVERGGVYIPIEIKKGNHEAPYKGHIMQLIAYCYLIEEKYGTKVPYGVIVYENSQIKIPYTEKEKEELLSVMNIMRTQKEFKRNHNSPGKCRACGFRNLCDESL